MPKYNPRRFRVPFTDATGVALFTPTEAAVLTRLSLKAVNNAIDKNLVPTNRIAGGSKLPAAAASQSR